MAISIRYPGQPDAVDASGLFNGISSFADKVKDRRYAKEAAEIYAQLPSADMRPIGKMLYGQQTPPQQQPMDYASQRVSHAHAASGGPPQGAIESYIRHAAQKRGIDPEIAIKVAMSEGGVTDPVRQSDVVNNGIREQSYGPFQLYMGGGLGNEFQQSTGLHPSDPGAWQKGIDFALDKAKEVGWGPWYGAAKAGIGERDGIGAGAPQGAGAQGEIRQGADGQNYQYAQTTGMAGHSGDQGWIRTSMGAGNPGDLLPPPEVMRALFRSEQTRPLAIQLAQSAQAARQGDPEAELRLRKLSAEVNNLENPSSRDKFGNSVIWGQDANGDWVAMQPSSGGGLVPAPVPDGVKLSPPGVGNLDLGNQIAIRDRSGNIVNTVDKDLAGAESQKVQGKDEGEARALYDSMVSKMPGLEQVVGRLDQLAGDATYTMAGKALDAGRRQLGMEPRDAAIARAEYTSIVDNQVLPLLRDTFGAQFTQAEGERLGRTLGDPDKSPEEKQALLRAFIEQKYRDIEALARRTGQSSGTGNRLRFNPATGELE